ncbi:MAG: hypothetical protein COU07_00250 [Candidatus Harrisonbacteria bacterium CG10_big_fil_rev_8_21_14_0_10_40_38]|uniref:Uncharacterized protein n=1 Tax=Candidatus Harrisonbacteria bacterium CG10_big_fil_rev_8_21_14_0_10_40_38 TaxID=1974583 RepID=A0A2H0USF7_9BACT|nr:MAG: hypothetical protein COU07_00250 [Candidatus Harrisonbacteria bacterium CG10_big_fil_rev_8_21_14_0_10_40_38]
MLILRKMKIKNFRSFVDDEIVFDDITAIVGANEGGKTNILDAIEHITSESPFKHDDLRKGSKNYPYGEIEINYTVTLTDKVIPELIEEVPQLNERDFLITKKGKLDHAPDFCFQLIDAKDLEKIITIKKVSQFKKKFDAEQIKAFDEALKRKWFVKKPVLNLTHSPFPQLRKEGVIEVIDSEQKINSFLSSKIIEELRSNTNIYFWKYNKGEFLKNITPINEFVANPNNFPAMKNLFTVAGWKKNDFQRYLVDTKINDAVVVMREVENKINKLIKKTWRQHRDLTISIQRTENDLLLNLQELNAPTPPEIRSDGLKWFLGFLINFRARAKNLSDFTILIDEPALHLHPRGQKDVLSEIKGLGKDNQIIYTTHQTFMLDRNHPERVRILTRESIKSGGHDYYFASRIIGEPETKDIISDPLLREALGFNVSDISPISAKNILVEGTFDRGLLLLLNKYFPSIDLEQFSIIACDGASDIKRFANFCLANELKIFCLYDSDESGKICHDNTSENAVPTNLKTHFKLLHNDFLALETPEDLFSLELFRNATRDVTELKDFAPTSSSPKMQQLKTFLDSKKISRDEKNEIKHKLEDALLKKLGEELNNQKISTGDSLVKLLVSLAEELKKRKI